MKAAVLRSDNDTVWSTFVGEEMHLNSRRLLSSNRRTDHATIRRCQRVGRGVVESCPSTSPCKTRANDQAHLPLWSALLNA